MKVFYCSKNLNFHLYHVKPSQRLINRSKAHYEGVIKKQSRETSALTSSLLWIYLQRILNINVEGKKIYCFSEASTMGLDIHGFNFVKVVWLLLDWKLRMMHCGRSGWTMGRGGGEVLIFRTVNDFALRNLTWIVLSTGRQITYWITFYSIEVTQHEVGP